jgi:Concanavalin A-like lectin/glucanases superfamily
MQRYRFAAVASLVGVLVAANSAFGVTILMLTNSNGSLSSSEVTLKSRLESLGHTVNTIWDGDSQANFNTAFDNNDIVYVPADVSATDIGDKLRDTQIGIVNELPDLMDELGLCKKSGTTTSDSSIDISTTAHYITSPFSTGSFSLGSSNYDIARLGGSKASGATLLAKVGNKNSMVAVDAGGKLSNTVNGSNIAAGRRVQMPIQYGVVNASTLTADTVTLISRTILWAASFDGQLVAYWKLDEADGSSAADSSGNGNDGSVKGHASWAAGVINNSFSFDGSTKIQVSGLMNDPRNVSVAAWANLTTADTDGAEVISLGGYFALRLDEGGVTKAIFFDGSSYVSANLSATFAGTGWHHFAATFDDLHNTLKLYVDGELAASTTTTASISYSGLGSKTVVGRDGDSGTTRDFIGQIDDVHVYSYALSPTEVSRLYGLIGRWNLNETSGATAHDSTIFGRNGVLSGSANWSTDCGGTGVFSFNGSSNYFSVANAADFQPTGMLSISAWINGNTWKNSSGGDVDTILRKGESTPNNYNLAVASGKVMFCLDDADTAGVRGNTVLNPGQWYHVAAIWDGATVKIYVNGVLDNSPGTARAAPISTDTRPLYIGGRSGTDYFDGQIRDLRIYNRPLTQLEIVQGAGLLGWWKFAEGSGTSAADSSALANTATLSGSADWTSDCAGNNNALLTNGAGGIAQTTAPFTPPDVGTIAFWMRSSGAPGGTATIMGLGDNWEVRQTSTGALVFDLGGDGGNDFCTTTALTDVGRWYHVAVTFDATTKAYAVYVDGQLQKSGTNSNTMSQQPAAILSFGTRTGSNQYWQGALRDVRIYNRRLCPTEIAAFYGLAGYWKLDETSGNTAADSSGLGRDGTVVGTPVWSSGAVNNALQVNSSTYMYVPGLMDSPKNVTLAAWANLTGTDYNGAELVSLGDYIAIRLDEGGSTKMFFYNGSGWDFVGVSQTFLNRGWHHFAAVFNDDANLATLYIDGVAVASSTTYATIPYSGLGTNLVVGRHGNNKSGWNFTGKIDDVRIYNRALCPLEIQALKNGGGTFGGVRITKWLEIQ